jgi:hypothetical protein
VPFEINIAILYNCQYYFLSNIATTGHSKRFPLQDDAAAMPNETPLNPVNAISI